jgi:outer membrane biosynthesis protein TonB
MSQSSLPSSLPPKPPTHSSGTGYIVAAVILLIAIVALIFFKLKGSREAPTPLATVPAATTPTLAEPPPPPPTATEPPALVDAGTTVAAVGNYNPCSAKCNGTSSTATNTAISARAGAARPCYERALRVNSALQGKLTVTVRVDPQGNVCGASVAQDAIHSPEVTNCVLGIFRAAKFPAPSGGCVEVNIPLSFVPREGK